MFERHITKEKIFNDKQTKSVKITNEPEGKDTRSVEHLWKRHEFLSEMKRSHILETSDLTNGRYKVSKGSKFLLELILDRTSVRRR